MEPRSVGQLAEKATLEDFCRLCLLRKKHLVPLTSDLNGVMIPEMLWKVSGTLINAHENLPPVICERCLTKLDLAYNVGLEFRKQEERLRSFCWKGALIDELEKFQGTEEAAKENYSETVIRKLVPEPIVLETREEPVKSLEVNELAELEQFDDIIEQDGFISGNRPNSSLDIIVEEITEGGDSLAEGSSESLIVQEDVTPVKTEIVLPDDDLLDTEDGPDYELLPFAVDQLKQEEWIESSNEATSIQSSLHITDPDDLICFSGESSSDFFDFEQVIVDESKQVDKKEAKRVVKSVTNENGEYVCGVCSKTFAVQKTFLNHVKRHEHVNKGSFKCEICHKAFGTKERLARHNIVHQQNLRCELCGHECRNGFEMRAHRIVHRKGKHRCGLCGLACESAQQLQSHVDSGTCPRNLLSKKSTGRPSAAKAALLKSNVCPFEGCDYTADTYGAMYVHKRAKHLQQFQCTTCAKKFAFANQLRVHEKIHTGEMPFECKKCPKRFRRMFSYKEHMATHEGADTYSCGKCGKTFSRPRYLAAHMSTHSNTRQFTCSLCGNLYKTKGELNKHVRGKHLMLEYGNENDIIEENYDYFEDELYM
ncbi:zinc finger protein 14 homolog [Sabethes cyaneus]|uniref:zinc finger protein 14 homolog n=1 Tax=Sabethes cyaneus TaxID=53552 RepID=UPI00237D3359|nr:zinc finger protein 14 homolog [Sabethes cyaneus]